MLSHLPAEADCRECGDNAGRAFAREDLTVLSGIGVSARHTCAVVIKI